MNTLEKFLIYKINKKGIQIDETYSDHTNPIYGILIKKTTLNHLVPLHFPHHHTDPCQHSYTSSLQAYTGRT
jgi:hypothetical protein